MSANALDTHYIGQLEQLQGTLSADLPPWLAQRRRAAAERFAESGFPDPRAEEWKYTNVRPIANKPFSVASECGLLEAATLEEHVFGELEPWRLVFENGFLRDDLSRLDGLAPGVRIDGLNTAIREGVTIPEQCLDGLAHDQYSSFATLNTAFLTDGAVIHLEPGVVLERPIHLVFYGTSYSENVWCHPRVLVVGESGCEATIIEHYVDGEGARSFTNTVTEIEAHAGAHLHHYLVQEHADTAYHVGNVFVRQRRDSVVTSHNVNLGGRLVRHDLNVDLVEPGAETHLNGLFLVGDRQHVDTHTRVHHAVPHTTSREQYRGIAQGRGRGVFKGRVLIREGAQKTAAEQHSANLLLSPNAEIDAKPELEIYADDVKAAHGATVGQLDADALYYLASRGIGPEIARGMLVYAFAEEVLEPMKLDPVRAVVENRLAQRLPEAVPATLAQA
ncbi:Fe-S cluster assembly protein SufD [Thioalkalivibrio sp. ALE23]|uniref:Fe-S cluster assembly protein SufD n=1 Tax=Thioalkalivibrio sp. ALE23 TaxID=1265495 RepID=UPI00035C3490|nr:Fe-S cluster assembly protein SufD [Thioalkalivibrio sp. ALE23]